MYCRFVAVDGISDSNANRGNMMLDVRKVLDGTYTAVSSLNATYWDKQASFIVGGGTGGLGAIKQQMELHQYIKTLLPLILVV